MYIYRQYSEELILDDFSESEKEKIVEILRLMNYCFRKASADKTELNHIFKIERFHGSIGNERPCWHYTLTLISGNKIFGPLFHCYIDNLHSIPRYRVDIFKEKNSMMVPEHEDWIKVLKKAGLRYYDASFSPYSTVHCCL